MAAANKSTGTKAKNEGKSTRSTAGNRAKTASVKSSSKNSKNRTAAVGNAKTKAEIERTHQRKIDDVNEYKDRMAFETGITLIVLGIISIFLYLSYFGLGGMVGKIFGGLFFGIFGWSAWILPIAVVIGYIFAIVNHEDRRVPRKLVSFAAAVWFLLGITDLLFKKEIISEYYTINHVMHKQYFECMNLTLNDVLMEGKANAGMLGRLISSIFKKITGEVGAVVIMTALFLLCLFIFNGMEFMAALRKRNAYKQEMEDTYEEISRQEDFREPSYRVLVSQASQAQAAPVYKPVRRSGTSSAMQAVDLRKMNMAFDEMEANARKKALDKSAMEEIVATGTKNQKSSPASKKDNSVSANKNSDSVPADNDGKVQIDNTQKELKLDYNYNRSPKNISRNRENNKEENNNVTSNNNINNSNINNNDISQNRQETDEERRRRNVESIPIFRDELNQKFGKKHKNAQEQMFVQKQQYFSEKTTDIEEKSKRDTERTTAVDDNSFGNKTFSSSVEKEVDDSRNNISADNTNTNRDINSQTFNTDNVASGLIIDESDIGKNDINEGYISESNINESNNSESDFTNSNIDESDIISNGSESIDKDFTNVTSKASGYHIGEPSEKSNNSSNVSASGQPVYKKPEKTTNHGRIGGDDYVSASDTFNALNDSKVMEDSQDEKEYQFPPIELLSVPKDSSGGMSDEELRQTAAKLQETLQSFNVNVKMGAVTCGPTVTRYELLPEQGVRVNKITNLADDLKLSLAAASIRIEAPIPGKSAVGIEVPNTEPSSVAFRELLDGEVFQNAKSPVTFAVGKDIAGKLIMTDIAKMPHLLIAGATGSGKSVCINTLIMSILYKANPNDVKLIMIDPKVVELSVYNGIPHLFCPVVTDPKEAAAALNWAVREMMDRYNKFTELGVRNIAGYNEKIKSVPEPEKAGYAKMPFLVIIVDEFADLMMVASKEVEDSVCRLAQLARAAGIHLVLATQRPSVNVITGVIKANIPSRIAFSVSSAIDSRTILDKGGAEKLLGKGDMLFFPSGYSEPVRVQGAFVSDKEVSDVVDFLCNNNEKPEYNDKVTEIVESGTENSPESKEPKSDRDEYFEEAGRFVIESERAAAGQLQRRFSIGFNRAGRIIDQLHKAGVVGPAEGTKPRKILMTMNDFDLLMGNVPPVPENEIEEVAQNFAGENEVRNEQY